MGAKIEVFLTYDPEDAADCHWFLGKLWGLGANTVDVEGVPEEWKHDAE